MTTYRLTRRNPDADYATRMYQLLRRMSHAMEPGPARASAYGVALDWRRIAVELSA